MRPNDLLGCDVALVWWQEGESELAGCSNGRQTLSPEPDAVDIPLT